MRSDLTWLVRRAASMSPQEVVWRTWREARDWTGRWRARLLPRKSVHLAGKFDGGEASHTPWLLDLTEPQGFRRLVDSRFGWTERRARELLDHRIDVFALQGLDLGTTIRWNHNYHSHQDTPLEYGPSLDYRDVRKVGDIKYAWEIQRHTHLPEIAKAYFLTGKEEYAEEVLAQVESWITACPYPLGIGWSSSLEAGIRIINWCFALKFLLARDPGLPQRDGHRVRRWVASAHEHLSHIAGHFSRYSSANNHLVGEAAGLFVGAIAFDFNESQHWAGEARTILEREIQLQTWPDGVNKEQATEYQVFAFDFFLIAGLLGGRSGVPFTAAYWSTMASMAEFVRAVLDDRGELPRIGDGDDGKVVELGPPSAPAARSLLACAAIACNSPVLAAEAGEIDEKTFWLTGRNEYPWPVPAREPKPGLQSFPAGGYHIVRGAEATLLFDAGPLGYLSIAAHGHADALSVLLWYRGRRFLIDPGTYAYFQHEPWRAYFRGTRAHNTLTIDGADQSVMAGRFMWRQPATCRFVTSDQAPLAAQHDGYTRLRDPLVHRREVFLNAQQKVITLVDVLECRGDHHVEAHFHCDPDCLVQIADGKAALIQNGDALIKVVPDASFHDVAVAQGQEAPILGWYSPGFDRKVPAPTIRCAGTCRGTSVFRTTIQLC